jgi:hypothetical protein
MAATTTVVGPRKHLSGAAQRSKARSVVRDALALIAAGDRDRADVLIYHAVHDGVSASALIDAVIEQAPG